MKRKTLKFLYIMSFIPIILAFITDTPENIFNGFSLIITGSDVLITDYIAVGGIGATLLNVGLIMYLSLIIIRISKAEINGTAIASVFLMGSFAFFGKNIVNVIPILLGTFLYAKYTKEPYQDIVHMSLLATCFAPLFTELIAFGNYPFWARLIVAFIVSASAGFFIKPVSRHLFIVHEGFNLYNTGFSVGILSTLYVSIMKSYGYESRQRLLLAEGYTDVFTYALIILFILFLITAFSLDRKVFTKYRKLLKESGYNDHDYLKKYGFATVLMNMAINGLASLFYVRVIAQGELNGPILGGILTVVGFSGLGKHIRNITPIFLGVFLGSLTKSWTMDQPAILFAALFGTALAPIAGHFGWHWGVIASFINSSVVLNSGQLHSGMNLYNTGFSVGIVAAVLVPIIRKLTPVAYKRQKRIDS